MSKKAILVLILAALVAIFAIQATLAPASNLGVTPGQFNALKKRVANLEAYVGGCLLTGKSVGVAQYDGYVWRGQDGTIQSTSTSALDLTAGTSDTPHFYLLAVSDPKCTNGTALHLQGLKLTQDAAKRIEAAIHNR